MPKGYKCILERCTQGNKMWLCTVLLVKINYRRPKKNPGKLSSSENGFISCHFSGYVRIVALRVQK